MKRRTFIAGLGSAAVWPVVAQAQQPDGVRRIGVLLPYDENDPVEKPRISAFTEALAGWGWTDGRNVRMDLRWGGGDVNPIRALAQELVGLQPDLIVTHSTPTTAAVQRETRTIPIVFANVADPVGSGFVAGLGSAAAWPAMVRAQKPARMRRIGVLMPGDENDPLWKPRLSAFTQALADLGWTDGRNVRMDVRWAGSDATRIRAFAQELVGRQPDIILASGAAATVALQRETRTIPIVFASLSDPVASGIVARLDRPSGNITGFAFFEPLAGGPIRSPVDADS